MENINYVANWFLSQDCMTHKKLQKLCYYAQAWSCALFNKPLFDNEIQAWVHGPVVTELYHVYADYKWNSIPQQDFDESLLCSDSLQILNAVYNTYGKFSGDQLESLTHSELPWQEARGDLEPWEACTNSISFESMKSYYGKKYAEAQND